MDTPTTDPPITGDTYAERLRAEHERGRLASRGWLARLPLIASQIGSTWTARPFVDNPDEAHAYNVARACYLDRTDGFALSLPVPYEGWNHGGDAGRITVRPVWPVDLRYRGGHQVWQWKSVMPGQPEPKGIHGITLKADATNAEIARAIVRRLLPVCDEPFGRMVIANNAHLAQERTTDWIHRQLCGRYGLTYQAPDDRQPERVIWCRSRGVDRIFVRYDGSIRVSLEDLDLDRAMRVLDELMGDGFEPCGEPECNGKTGDDHSPDYYCAGGRPWHDHTTRERD